VRIHQYPDDTLALFHGPSCIARYDAQGRQQTAKPIASRAKACSAPPRGGRAKAPTPAGASRRPPVTAPARALARLA
jgi:hypothetical protein